MTQASMEARTASRSENPCVPIVRLGVQHFTVNRGDTFQPRYEDVQLPVISLAFDYGGRVVDACDLELPIADNDVAQLNRLVRSPEQEREARMVLESYGAIDLDCLDDYGRDLSSRADYLVSLEEDPSAYCTFTACALPELTRRGFVVELEPGYPYRMIAGDVSWYAEVARDENGDERPDWFGLELGVDIDGKRVNLVPVLLEMLDRSGEIASLRALERGTEKLLVVAVGDLGYARVAPEWLKRVWAVLVELYSRAEPGGQLRIDSTSANTLRSLDEAFSETGCELRWDAELPVCDISGAAFLEEPERVSAESLPVQATLRPYQIDGVSWLQHLTRHKVGGVLADDMGLGKTLQTISHLALEHTGKALLPPSLVVCPTSLVGNWQRELSRFAPQLRLRVYHGKARHHEREWLDGSDVIVTSYPILLRDAEVFEALEYHVLVLDEAQAIKNPSSSAHAAVKALKASHRLCLTGTPIENRLAELWSLFDFLSPGLLGDSAAFKARYAASAGASLNDQARLTALHERVSPFILRRMKDTVAPDLPPKILTVVPVELTGKQRELYETIRSSAHHDVRRAIRSKGMAGSTIAVLDALMKLRQLCCDPRLVGLEAARFVRESAKLTRLMQLLEAHLECKRRVLVFSQFTSMLTLIGQALGERDIDYLELTGATQNRQARVDMFERGHADVFLISLKAGGTGLNLVSADTVIHFDPWWNPAAQDQATDRAYRIGQTKPVLVQELIAVGSVEERMRVLAEQKRALARAILHGHADQATGLTEELVDDLLAPLEY